MRELAIKDTIKEGKEMESALTSIIILGLTEGWFEEAKEKAWEYFNLIAIDSSKREKEGYKYLKDNFDLIELSEQGLATLLNETHKELISEISPSSFDEAKKGVKYSYGNHKFQELVSELIDFYLHQRKLVSFNTSVENIVRRVALDVFKETFPRISEHSVRIEKDGFVLEDEEVEVHRLHKILGLEE